MPFVQNPLLTSVRRRLFCFLVILSPLLLAGCSNNPYPAGETAQSVLYRTLLSDLKSLDPAVAYTSTEGSVIDCIYPGFYHYDYLKQSPNFELKLVLGAEEPQRKSFAYRENVQGKAVQKQGEEWTFRIKKGLRFQDDPCFPGGKGREITADDLLYSFRRMADPKVDCPVLSFFADKVLGFQDFIAHSAERAEAEKEKDKHKVDTETEVAGLQRDPNDPYTFHIRLNQPYPQLRFLMAMHFTSPIAHEATEYYKGEFARHPVGCGAFKLTEYIEKQRVTLEENPNRVEEFYPTAGDAGDREKGFLDDAGKRLPLAKKVVFNFIKEPITAWNLFQQGYLDSAGVAQTNYRQVLSRPGQLSDEMLAKGINLRHSASVVTEYFAFNMNDPQLGGFTPEKKKLRQAISIAIDAQAFIDLFYQGRGIRAQSLLAPGLFGYDPAFLNPYRQHDLAKAKALLAEGGYPGGIDPKTHAPLTFDFDIAEGGAAGRQYAGLLSKQMEEIGIHLNVKAWRDIVLEQRVQDGKFQFVNSAWGADYPDPENFLFLLYGPNKKINTAQYDSSEYNRLFERMRAMDDGPERMQVIRQMRDLLTEDCPWVCMVHPEDLGISYGWVHNNKPHGVAGDTLKYIRVEGERRAQLQSAWNHPNYWPMLGVALFLVAGSLPAVATVRQRQNRTLRREKGPNAG